MSSIEEPAGVFAASTPAPQGGPATPGADEPKTTGGVATAPPAAPATAGSPSAPTAPGSPVARRIAAEVASLATLAELPLAEHADAYQRVHVELQRALAEIDGA